MKVFITGATGYIGSAVAEAVRSAGHEVIGLVRTPEGIRQLQEQRIAAYAGDLANPRALADMALRADATIHAAAGRDADAPLADEALANALLDRLAGTGKHFIYTSGVWVMGSCKDADENTPVRPAQVVAWRATVEQKVLKASERGIRTVVIRPGMVYGRGGGVVAGFVRSARDTGAAVMVGDGDNHWSFVHVEDLADLYVLALGASPGALYIAATEVRRVRAVAEAASRAAGAKGRVQAWEVEEAFKQLGPLAEALALDQTISTNKAKKQLHWNPHAPSVMDEIRHGSYSMKARGGRAYE
jgi:nucleoside-diphosphate-sugar epimerase